MEPRPLFDNKNEIIRQAEVIINYSVFDDIKAGLMEKYSDTTKWRIDDMSGDDFNVPILLIYSTDNDARPYIQLAGLYDQTSISYSNVDYYANIDENFRNEQMHDL